MKTKCRFRRLLALAVGVSAAVCFSGTARGEDWPQLQHDAARLGRTKDTVPPPFRARWVWMGPENVLRNKDSKSGDEKWKDDLASANGKNMAMSKTLPFSFGGSMQPIMAAGRVFVGDAQSKVYAINLDDGATLWSAENPGGTLWPGVASDRVVAFASLYGMLTAWDAAGGKQLWQVDLGRAVTSAPALADGIIYAADQGGFVSAVQLADGKVLWKSPRLSGPIIGGLCVANGKVYVGTEAVEAVALDAASGKVVATQKVTGQGFRFTWPVAVKDRVIFQAVSIVCPGSEYVNDGVLAGRPGQTVGFVQNAKPGNPSAAAEDEAMRKWLAGSGKNWEETYSLKADTLAKDYIVGTGATEGCGTSPNPPAVDWNDRPLLWFATAYPTLAKKGTFGSSYAMDVSSFDLDTGKRVLIDNKKMMLSTTESDNLYGLTVGGDILYLRQNFRGTQYIDLKTSNAGFISAQYRWRDGGSWPAPINYAEGSRQNDASTDIVRTPSVPAAASGRVGPAIAGGYLLFTEDFGVTCAETAKPQ